MKKSVMVLLGLLGSFLSGWSQRDAASTPPGAPLVAHVGEDEGWRMLPKHPGNAGERVQVSNFAIIESTSANAGHNMDTQWRNLLLGMGHTATIYPQTTLDNTAFFTGTDALIVSSGVIGLTVGRINTIQQFLISGKPVYLQGEYLPTYTANTGFANVVNATGGSFAVGSTVSGDLTPCTVLNSYATTPNAVPSIGYHWYGCTGSGCNNIEYFMRYAGNNLGFVYCPTNLSYGDMIQNTDQDWIRVGTSLPLMQNIVYALLSGNACSVVCGTVLDATRLELSGEREHGGAVRLKGTVDAPLPAGRMEVLSNGRVLGEWGVSESDGLAFTWRDQRLVGGRQHYVLRYTDASGLAHLSGEWVLEDALALPTLRIAVVEGGARIWLRTDAALSELWLVDLQGRRTSLEIEGLGQAEGAFLSLGDRAAGVYGVWGKTQDGQVVQGRIVWPGA